MKNPEQERRIRIREQDRFSKPQILEISNVGKRQGGNINPISTVEIQLLHVDG